MATCVCLYGQSISIGYSKLLKHIDGVGSNNWYPVFLWVPPGSAFVWPHTKDSSIIVIFRSTFDCLNGL